MSPWRSQGELEFGVAVIERDPTIESLVEADLSAGEAEAAALGRDLKTAAVPLHHVVVADHARVDEAADTVQIGGRGAPGGGRFPRTASEAAVVVGDKAGEHSVSRVQIIGAGQTKFTAQAILQHAPEAFDAALGLGRAGGDEGDTELFQGASELCGIALAGELLGDGPGVVVAQEDGTVIAVEGQRHTVAAQQLTEQDQITESRFGGKELGGEDFSAGIILQAQSGEMGAAAFEPIMRRTVELHQFPFAGRAQAALAVSGGATFAGRSQAGLTQQAANSFAAEGKALDLAEFLAEVVIVKAGVGGAGQTQNGAAHPVRQAPGTGAPAVGVSQSRFPVFAQAFL